MVKHAESLDDLYNHQTDVNALFNDYILSQARQDIEINTDIDIVDDYDTYYFQNYLDCPLQYTNECVEALEDAIKEKELTKNDFNKYSLYVLEDMGIEV